MQENKELFDILKARFGGQIEVLSSQEKAHWQNRWREAFGGPYQAKFGQGDLQQYDWHLFSFKVHPAIGGDAARKKLSQRAAGASLLMIPSDLDRFDQMPAFALSGTKRAPDLSSLYIDYMVFPKTLEWSYACTHEDGWIGPYFAERTPA